MRRTFIFLVAYFLSGTLCFGQITIASGTVLKTIDGTVINSTTGFNNLSGLLDLSTVNLTLEGTNNWSLTTGSTTEVKIGSLTLNGASDYTLNGKWTILNSLTLTQGRLIINPTGSNPGKLIYEGATDIVEGNSGSYVNGLLFMKGTGPRTFPIGNGAGYFPVTLYNVTDASTLIGFQVVTSNVAIAPPERITEVFEDHFWQLTLEDGPFSGSKIGLSDSGTETFFATGSPAVLEVTTDNNVNDLGGGNQGGSYIKGGKAAGSNGKSFAIAKSAEELVPKIGNVITPNSDGKNDFLQIENIDYFEDNRVTFLDRYGVVLWTKEAFASYPSPEEAAAHYDYAKLALGNYICVVEYQDRNGDRLKKSQMITVLK